MVQRDIIIFFSGIIFNELLELIEKQPHIIQFQNVSDSIFVKVNDTLVKENNHLIQISLRDFYNDIILLVSQSGFYGEINEDGKLFIEDTSLIKYMPKHVKPMREKRSICGYETCISAILFQYDLNKWRLTQLEKLDKLYIHEASTRLLKILKSLRL